MSVECFDDKHQLAKEIILFSNIKINLILCVVFICVSTLYHSHFPFLFYFIINFFSLYQDNFLRMNCEFHLTFPPPYFLQLLREHIPWKKLRFQDVCLIRLQLDSTTTQKELLKDSKTEKTSF